MLAVGTEMADTDYWRERLPLNAEPLRADIHLRKFNDFYPCTVALQGDAQQTVAALLARLPERHACQRSHSAVDALRKAVKAGHCTLQLIHQAILDRVSAELPDNAFVSSDMTQLAYTGNYAFSSHAPRSWLHPTGYGTLGYGLPAGIGAKFGAPNRPGLVLVGDGGFLYTAKSWPPPGGTGQPAGGAAVEKRCPGADPRRYARPGYRAHWRAAAQPGFRRVGPCLWLHRDPAAEPG